MSTRCQLLFEATRRWTIDGDEHQQTERLLTDNYALYISAAKRSQQAGMIQALTQRHSENDQQLLTVLESAGGDR